MTLTCLPDDVLCHAREFPAWLFSEHLAILIAAFLAVFVFTYFSNGRTDP